jgi:hypothetical protein
MKDLPIHPSRGTEAPSIALERRLRTVTDLGSDRFEVALRGLRVDCVFETLRLTGKGVSRKLVEDVASKQGAFASVDDDALVISGQLAALDAIDKEARTARDLTSSLIRKAHRLCSPPDGGELRSEDIPAQFSAARSAPPELIRSRLENLLEWLAAESAKSMAPAERMALFFARYLEIAPFARGNFRSAHLLANFFSRSSGFPFVTLSFEEADVVRDEVERAMRFDTAALVTRFTTAIERALSRCEESADHEASPGRETETPP